MLWKMLRILVLQILNPMSSTTRTLKSNTSKTKILKIGSNMRMHKIMMQASKFSLAMWVT